HSLNFVSLNGGSKHVTHDQGSPTIPHGGPRLVVGYRENRAEIVRGVSPFGSQPGVVVIEPTYHAADVKGGFDGIKLEWSPRHARPKWYDSPWHEGAKMSAASWILQSQKGAAGAIQKTIPCGVERFVTPSTGIQDVIGDGDEVRLRVRTDIAFGFAWHERFIV